MNPYLVIGLGVGAAIGLLAAARHNRLPKRVPGQAAADLEEHWASLNDIFGDPADVADMQQEAARRAWDRHHGQCLERRLEEQFGRRFVRQFDVIDGPHGGEA